MAKRSLKFRLIFILSLLCTSLLFAFSFAGRPGKAEGRGDEYVTIYAGDCVTPQTIFQLGDTVCVEVGNFPAELSSRFRRIQWTAPDTSIVDIGGVKTDPQLDRFIIPTTGEFAQVGTWYVNTISASGEGYASAKFIVRSPLFRMADLWVTKLAPDAVLPGDRLVLTLQVGNPGPDFAEGVEFVTEVPSDMVFLAVKQASGTFFECSTPPDGGTGRTICRTKGMEAGEQAEFNFYYQVNPEARPGTVCSGGSSVSSFTEERNKSDNFWTTEVTVASPKTDDGTDGGPIEP